MFTARQHSTAAERCSSYCRMSTTLSSYESTRAGGSTPVPRTPRSGEGGGYVCSGPHVTYEKSSFLNVFKIFVKISCIMKSTSSVVTYLIFIFFYSRIQHVLLTRTVDVSRVCIIIVHTV